MDRMAAVRLRWHREGLTQQHGWRLRSSEVQLRVLDFELR